MDIRDFAYGLYQLKWVDAHCNLQIIKETMIDAFEEGISLQEYVTEYGFKGINECFVDYEEFIDNEYRDEEVMLDLFDDDEKYMELWEKDLLELEEE